MSISSQQLEQFLAVYRQGGIGKASRALGLTQPALSKSLRRLEDQLRVQLFERRPNGLVPTLFADTLARRAEVVCSEVDLAEREIATLRDGDLGQLRIGSSPAIASFALPEVVAGLLEAAPRLRVLVIEGLFERLAGDVAAGALDLAVTTRPLDDPPDELELTTLCLERFVIATAQDHPILQAPTSDPALLLQQPWVLPPTSGLLWQRFVTQFQAFDLPPPAPRIETNSASLMKGLAARAGYLTLLPEQLVATEILRGELRTVEVPGFRIDREICVVARKNVRLPQGARRFLQALQRAFEASPFVSPD